MVQGKKQLNSKPKFAEVVIGDNEAKEIVLFSYSSASSFIASFNVLKRTLMFASILISASVLFRKVLLSSCNLPAVCSRALRS